MKNKKYKLTRDGFTLIEMLGIIILLAIIALITVPLIFNLIHTSREKARLQTVKGIIRATDLYITNGLYDDDIIIEENIYSTIRNDIPVGAPEAGEIFLDENKNIALAVKLDRYCYVKNYNSDEIIRKIDEDCAVLPSTSDKCFTYRQLFDYDINYDKCVEKLATYNINGRVYSESDIKLLCEGEKVIYNGMDLEDMLNNGYFNRETLSSLGIISNVSVKNEVIITGYNCYKNNPDGYEVVTDVILPNKISGLQVAIIGKKAFFQKDLTSINFSKAKKLTKIDEEAAYNNQIEGLIFPESIEIIEDGAFGLNKLSGKLDLSYLPNLKKISGFQINEIDSIVLPNNVETIGDYAFASNYITGKLDLSDTKITAIGNYAFRYSQIENIKLPSSTETIGKEAFLENKISNVLDLSDTKVTTIGESAFRKNIITAIKLPTSVEKINKQAFWYNDITGELDLSNTSITIIGKSAFAQNNNLKSVKFPNSLEIIEDQAFSPGFLNCTLDFSNTNLTTIGYQAFAGQIKSVKLPSNLEIIESDAFKYGFSTVELDLSNMTKLKTIKSSAFAYNSIQTVKLPSSVETIESSAFEKNNKFNSLTTIINPTEKEFDWAIITNSTTPNQSFIIGTITHQNGDITVTDK